MLAVGLPAFAGAAQVSPTDAPAVAAATIAADDAADPASTPHLTAAPTDGADVAMWNAAPEKPEAAVPVDKAASPHLGHLVNVKKFATGIAARGIALASTLTHNAMKFLGVPYVFGGTSVYGFDCSGYVQHVFAMIGVHLPRTADAQYAFAHRIIGKPKAGDLVFFQTYEPGASHVGISLGGDRFVHASSSHGVMVSSLHDSYWAARYLGAKRVVTE
jgi:cell wall-associated NlpC family hydrolase